MRKEEFIDTLKIRLKGLPKEEVSKSIEYYEEMIDDRIEDGLTEEEAVCAVGNLDEIILQIKTQILADTPLPTLIKRRLTPDRALKAWEIILLILGAPIWFSLALAGAIIVGTVYAVLWILIAVGYIVNTLFAVVGIACLVALFFYLSMGKIGVAFLALGAGLILASFSVLLFPTLIKITQLTLKASKSILLFLKSCFIKKEV